MLVAFATTDLAHADAEFKSAPYFAVYEVSIEGARLERVVDGSDEGRPRRFEERVRLLPGCKLLFVSAAGPSIVARLLRRGVRVATSRDERRIAVLIESVASSSCAPFTGW